MAFFSLPFGQGSVTVEIGDEQLNGVLTSQVHTFPSSSGEEELVKEALRSPVATASLREQAQGKENIVIISSDHTRPLPSRITMPLLLEEIREGNPRAHITILIATGCHRSTTHQELVARFGETITSKEHISIHDAQRDEMVDLGALPSGNRLLLNALAVKADLLLAEGCIEPHFFAGFSGGRKSVLPGIASQETILTNHCAEFIDDAHACSGNVENNPIHEDMVFAAEKARLAFILNVVINNRQEIIHAVAGNPQLAHQAGCDFLSRLATVAAIPSPIVMTTNDGYPLDQNIYQAVKGISAAAATCEEGGVIICVACCADGHGGKDFFESFSQAQNPREILTHIRGRDRKKTLLDQWESQILARILHHFTVILVTQAPREMVEAMMMKWAPDVETALEMARSIKGDGKITVIPYGVSVIVQGYGQEEMIRRKGGQL